jgi:hypothetical protein
LIPASLVALQILLILLPGFAAAALIDSLAIRGKQTDFQRSISACLYSFVIYSFYVLFSRGNLPFHLEGQGTANAYVVWSRYRLFILLGITVVLGIAVSIYINFDAHRILRKVRLTERTTRHSIWNDIFESVATSDQIVQIELDGDRSVIGVLTYYSDDSEDCSVFVSQAAWVDSSGTTTEIPGQGILLTKNSGIRSISLLQKTE